MLNKTHSAVTKAKISGALQDKFHFEETKALMSLVKLGEDHPMFGITGENHSNYDKLILLRLKLKLVLLKELLFMYMIFKVHLFILFTQQEKQRNYFFYCSYPTILKYTNNSQQPFKEQWILSTFLITKE